MCPPRLSLTEIPTTLVIILTYRLGMGMQKKCCQYLPCHKRKGKGLDREDVVGIKKRQDYAHVESQMKFLQHSFTQIIYKLDYMTHFVKRFPNL